MKKKVPILVRLPAPARALLDARDDVEYELVTDWSPESVRRAAIEADGIIMGVQPFSAETIAHANRLKVVSRFGVGYDAIDVPALTARGIPLTVVGEANSVSVAEQALFMMLALAKRGPLYDHEVRGGNWNVRFGPMANDLWQKTVLVLGFGRIGTRLVKRCVAMEMEVLVYDPYVDDAKIAAAGAKPVSDLDAALAQADFVSVHTPKNEETTGLIGARQLEAMKPTAYLVNTARGGIVDESALREALEVGAIGGAGLDVFVSEPAKPGDPLLDAPNVIVSPHSAGVSFESSERMGIAAVQNVLDMFDGRVNPDNVVNKEVL